MHQKQEGQSFAQGQGVTQTSALSPVFLTLRTQTTV